MRFAQTTGDNFLTRRCVVGPFECPPKRLQNDCLAYWSDLWVVAERCLEHVGMDPEHRQVEPRPWCLPSVRQRAFSKIQVTSMATGH